jgi:hypothetical protein
MRIQAPELLIRNRPVPGACRSPPPELHLDPFSAKPHVMASGTGKTPRARTAALGRRWRVGVPGPRQPTAACLAARAREHDDERDICRGARALPTVKGRHGGLGTAAEANDLEARVAVVLQRAGHLVEEVGKVGREVMRQVGKAKALSVFAGACRSSTSSARCSSC